MSHKSSSHEHQSYMNWCFYSAPTIFINVIYTLIYILICSTFGEEYKVFLKSNSNRDANISILIVNISLEERAHDFY